MPSPFGIRRRLGLLPARSETLDDMTELDSPKTPSGDNGVKDAAPDEDWETVKRKYEEKLDSETAIGVPAALIAGFACEQASSVEVRSDMSYVSMAYVIVLSFVSCACMLNVAVTSLIYFQGKKIFSLKELAAVKDECKYFDVFWQDVDEPRTYCRNAFVASLPLYMVSMALRPGLWDQPCFFSYFMVIMMLAVAFVTFRWGEHIKNFRTRTKLLRKAKSW